MIVLSAEHYSYTYRLPTNFLDVPQEIRLPYDLSVPGEPSSKIRIFPLDITALCYIANCRYFRLCFEEKLQFLTPQDNKKFCAGQNVAVFFDSCVW